MNKEALERSNWDYVRQLGRGGNAEWVAYVMYGVSAWQYKHQIDRINRASWK